MSTQSTVTEMTELANSAGGWLSRNITAQFIFSVLGAAVMAIGFIAINKDRLDTMSAQQALLEAASAARSEKQDALWRADHERLLLVESKLDVNTSNISRTDSAIASVLDRIDSVEKSTEIKIGEMQAEQRRAGELLATLIERLANISSQLENLNRLMRDRLPFGGEGGPR